MISIIISSQKKEILENVTENIANTIGVPFEIISFNNADGKMGICEVYNKGIDKASFDILCFTHEDVFFESNDWGKKVVAHLAAKKIGLIGLAGGDTKSIVPSSWSSTIFQSEINIVQYSRGNSRTPERICKTGYPESNAVLKPVIAIDGVWMCTRKDVANQFRFDSSMLKGFHGYDIDFSLQVQTAYQVGVVFDILVHHFSDGSYNKAWIEAMIAVSNKWKKRLPVSVRQLSKKEYTRQHWTALKAFLGRLEKLGYSKIAMLSHLLKYSGNKYFYLPHFLHVLRLVWTKQLNRQG